jgi:RND family efflux transporter MFP subunit
MTIRDLLLGAISLLPALAASAAGPLETAVAEYTERPRELRLDGVVDAVNRTTVSAQTKGQVEEILFDVDDYVEKGQVIVRLRATEQQAEVSAAEAALEEARARLREARDNHARIEEVYGKKLVAKSELDKALAELKSARARADSAQASLTKAREQLDYTLVRAPYSGIVTERHVEPGETAQPGQPLMTGLSLEKLRVNVDVPQGFIDEVRRTPEARVVVPDGDAIAGREITVFPYADPASNTFRVRVELAEGTQGLFPGMFVKAVFSVGTERRMLVPAEAVVYRSEVTAVYVVDADGRVGFRHVRVGRQTSDGRIEILAGLEEGERVALDPIAAGTRLREERSGSGDG